MCIFNGGESSFLFNRSNGIIKVGVTFGIFGHKIIEWILKKNKSVIVKKGDELSFFLGKCNVFKFYVTTNRCSRIYYEMFLIENFCNLQYPLNFS